MKKCTKQTNVLTDVQLVAEPPDHLFRYRGDMTPENKQRILKEWVSEFHSFIRDHRSCDPVNLYVEQTRKDLCSACGHEWETYEDDGKTCCAHCGAEVDVVNVSANAA